MCECSENYTGELCETAKGGEQSSDKIDTSNSDVDETKTKESASTDEPLEKRIDKPKKG